MPLSILMMTSAYRQRDALCGSLGGDTEVFAESAAAMVEKIRRAKAPD
jgi:hypothetical protein